MSVQRWTWNQVGEAGPKAAIYILYADHARIVAEAQARWVEIARQDRMAAHQRGAQEAERQHAKALADAEQAHAAALLTQDQQHMAALAEQWDKAYLAGASHAARLAEAAAPRTLTADDPYTRGLADARAAVDAVGRWRSFPDDTLLSRAAVLAAIDTLIHDGGAA